MRDGFFPSHELLAGVEPEQLKDNEVPNLDPQKWQAVKGSS
jgi:hypothetical protein